jgi:membrane-associated phospholipid phosphatase
MSTRAGSGGPLTYVANLVAVAGGSVAQLVRPPSHSRRAVAARRLARHSLVMTALLSVVIVAMMYVLDAHEIRLMPERGTPSLWPVRILTELGKDAYVLTALGGMLLIVGAISAALRGTLRADLLGFGTRLQFLFFAVLAPLLVGEVLKWIVGRGRPFVGGEANPFHFVPFSGTGAYSSFPSAHSITAFALAFAVSAVWPRARLLMIVYALVIAGTRLLLLSHHPSDVVAGALIGVIGAMSVRYWFAARRLGFAIRRDGEIVPLRSLSGHSKRVARMPSAP